MTDSEKIKEICNKNLSLATLYSSVIGKVDGVTVRTKGQIFTERFFYIREGTQTFTLEDGSELVTKKGDIVYLPPDVAYVSRWVTCPEGKAISIMFSMEDNTTISDRMFVIAYDKYETYLKLFLEIAEIFEQGKLGYKIKGQSLFWQIYHTILTEALSKDGKDKSSVHKGIIYIENNYMEKIDIDQLAKMCYISPATFRRKFKSITGMSPVEYKNMLKIKKASELLKTGEFSVSEASKAVGIDDIYYFSKMFKKYMEKTALNFVKQNQELKIDNG